MIRPRKTKRGINSINYYIILSALIHLFLFLFTSLKKDIALGDKLIPVEIIDIPSIASKGEYFQREERQGAKEIIETTHKEKETKKEINKEIEDLHINEVSKTKRKQQQNITTPEYSGINKDRGSKGKLNSNELEKGSIKGKGFNKITCLDCKLPNYPTLALRRGAEGKILVKVWINKKGKVFRSLLLRSSGVESMDIAAINAAEKSIFYEIEDDSTLNIEYEMKVK